MAVVKNLKGQVLDGWERGRTSNGIPYYITHREETTQWDHPEVRKLLEELQQFNTVKYAAYRTAIKLKYLINALNLNLVRLNVIDRALRESGFQYSNSDELLSYFKLETLLFSICELTHRDSSFVGLSSVNAELLLNFLLNTFDEERKNGVSLISVTVLLGILCAGRLHEKYKYLAHFYVDKSSFILKRHIQVILHNIAKIPEILGEKLSFGTQLVPAALESCCKQNCGLLEMGFLEWLHQEPQTLVWLPTFTRLKASELVEHPVRCSICKANPIIGLRYCCLHCLKYDICQSCFFHGLTSKGHKLTHPMREFCQPSTTWEDTKTLLKALKNRLNKWQSARNKTSYLPIAAADPKQSPDCMPVNGMNQSNGSSTVTSEKSGRLSVPLDPEHQRELESIIVRLEDENKHLSQEIEKFHALSDNGSSGGSRSSQGSWDAHCQKEFLLARQELLEDHSHQMELQIKRLKELLKYLCKKNLNSSRPSASQLTLPKARISEEWAESTPLTTCQRVPAHQWSPFVKLQSELDVLERLTSSLQDGSRQKSSSLQPTSDTNFFSPSRTRRSCRGVSFTDRCSTSEGIYSSPFERHGSVRTKQQQCSVSFQPSALSTLYDNCKSGSRVTFSTLNPDPSSVAGGSRIVLPRMPTPPNPLPHVDAELQAIIEQLERVLPCSWSNSPSLLPDERVKVIHAVNNMEEAMAQYLDRQNSASIR